MNITKHFDWGINSQNHWLFFEYSLTFFSKRDNVFSSECKVAITIVLCGPFSWSQQMGEEQIVEGVFLHAWLGWHILSCSLLFFFEFLHWNVNCFAASWLLLYFSVI
jgi:hypothetical protein